jgi:hypothetical protein
MVEKHQGRKQLTNNESKQQIYRSLKPRFRAKDGLA